MAQRKPLVIVNGQIQQLQSGDVLDASVNEVDVVSKQNDNAGAIVIGQPVYTKTNGNVDLAQADAGATVEILGNGPAVEPADASTTGPPVDWAIVDRVLDGCLG